MDFVGVVFNKTDVQSVEECEKKLVPSEIRNGSLQNISKLTFTFSVAFMKVSSGKILP